ncbi:hypothetical protein PMIN01_12916 [Paraphaeosphaeria minitans]|uniref:Uncharacterized protein n=1 Tax=Paraphaeosphaeria minitans TaxID=565426 RepID=A0A9P6G5Y6_9PLEO|nr:hypothetical protein PMIN01_12916 [Paraphaeosphaeria minitans]
MTAFRDSQSTFYTLCVCIHPPRRQPNGMSNNHVSVFPLLAENQGAVRLDMTTQEGNPSGFTGLVTGALPALEHSNHVLRLASTLHNASLCAKICALWRWLW